MKNPVKIPLMSLGRLRRNLEISMVRYKQTNKTIMKAYVYSGEISDPDFKYEEESVYSLIELIKFLPDSDVVSFSVQDLKKLIGIKCESSIDFSLK